jgi:hypothetical protein
MLEKYNLNKLVGTERIFKNEVSGEVIVKVNNDTVKIKSLIKPVETVFVTMERLSSNGSFFVDESGKWIHEGGKYQSKEIAYNGENSVLLTKKQKYALKTILPVESGLWVRMEAYQLSKFGESAVFVASSENSEHFYKTSKPAIFGKKKCTKSSFNFQITDSYADSTIILSRFL